MSFTVTELNSAYKQEGSGPWTPPPFPGTPLGPNPKKVGDGGPPFPSTEKQNNRQTNLTVPYSRRAGIPREELWEHQLRHGELVFSHGRLQAAAPRLSGGSINSFVSVHGIRYVNEYMNNSGPLPLPQANKNAPPFSPLYSVHPLPPRLADVEELELGLWLPELVRHWTPDGVVNVVDQLGGSEDDVNNITVQGMASMINGQDNREQIVCSRGDLPLTSLYVGLRATRVGAAPPYAYTYKFELFSAGMLRRGDVVMDNFLTGSKLIKAWQYGRIMDSRHVDEKDEKRCMVNFFLQPPILDRPAQPTDTPRMGSVHRGSRLSPPSGLAWRRVDELPAEFVAYQPVNAAGINQQPSLVNALTVAAVAAVGLGGAPPEYITLTLPIWDALGIVHSHRNGATTLFYNMYLRINGVVYVPVPNTTRGGREGAFALPNRSHGRDYDPWAGPRAVDFPTHDPNLVEPDGTAHTYPQRPRNLAPAHIIDEVTFGRRPGWDEADVENQLKRSACAHIHRANENDRVYTD
jgi:hypothetical protein